MSNEHQPNSKVHQEHPALTSGEEDTFVDEESQESDYAEDQKDARIELAEDQKDARIKLNDNHEGTSNRAKLVKLLLIAAATVSVAVGVGLTVSFSCPPAGIPKNQKSQTEEDNKGKEGTTFPTVLPNITQVGTPSPEDLSNASFAVSSLPVSRKTTYKYLRWRYNSLFMETLLGDGSQTYASLSSGCIYTPNFVCKTEGRKIERQTARLITRDYMRTTQCRMVLHETYAVGSRNQFGGSTVRGFPRMVLGSCISAAGCRAWCGTPCRVTFDCQHPQ